MEIITDKSHIKIIIPTNDIDFDQLINLINQVPVKFRDHLIANLGISKETFYMKKREKSFKLLECQKLTELTGIEL